MRPRGYDDRIKYAKRLICVICRKAYDCTMPEKFKAAGNKCLRCR